MMLALVPPLFMSVMHPRLDAYAAARAAQQQGGPQPEAAAAT